MQVSTENEQSVKHMGSRIPCSSLRPLPNMDIVIPRVRSTHERRTFGFLGQPYTKTNIASNERAHERLKVKSASRAPKAQTEKSGFHGGCRSQIASKNSSKTTYTHIFKPHPIFSEMGKAPPIRFRKWGLRRSQKSTSPHRSGGGEAGDLANYPWSLF